MLGMASAASAVALSTLDSRPARAQDNVLSLLSWPGHGDPAVVGAFEQEFGVKVVTKEYVGGEAMLALINQSPPGSFDVVLADSEYVSMLKEGGFIDPMNPADYPLDDYWPEFQKFDGHWFDNELYAVIERFNLAGLAYRTDVLTPEDVKSYKILWGDKLKGKIGFFDWYLPTMGCLSLAQGNKPPYDIDDAHFEALKESLFSLRAQAGGFYSMADMFSMISNGQAAVIPGQGTAVALILKKSGVPVEVAIPEEGGLLLTESLSICASSTKKDLAKKFIQYKTSPQGQAAMALLPAYNLPIPNRKGWELLNKEKPDDAKALGMVLDGPNIMDEFKKGNLYPRMLPAQQGIEAWNEAWSEFKAM